MAKVMAFGTYDGVHDGHRHFLNQASAYGDLRVIVARDETVKKLKGRPALKNELERLRGLRGEGYDAVLGRHGDKYAVIREYEPDTICLGYDQEAFTDKLETACGKMGLETTILRMPAHEPNKLKSSLINNHPHATL